MTNSTRIIIYGAGVWAIPFLAGSVLFGLQGTYPGLFKSLMAVSVCLAAVLFGYRWLKHADATGFGPALSVGLMWLFICLLIDLPIFVFGLKMPITSYFTDIGPTYLIVPVTLLGLALCRDLGFRREIR